MFPAALFVLPLEARPRRESLPLPVESFASRPLNLD
jgi:hypothetical protein